MYETSPTFDLVLDTVDRSHNISRDVAGRAAAGGVGGWTNASGWPIVGSQCYLPIKFLSPCCHVWLH